MAGLNMFRYHQLAVATITCLVATCRRWCTSYGSAAVGNVPEGGKTAVGSLGAGAEWLRAGRFSAALGATGALLMN